MNIPRQLCGGDFRFVLIKPKAKIPFEKDWQNTANYPWSHEKIKNHDGNIGILTGIGDLIIFDCDCQMAERLARQLPETLVIGTSTTADGYLKKHFYFRCPLKEKKILKDHDTHLGEIQAKGQQCIIPPSIHPSGSEYKIIECRTISIITETILRKTISTFCDFGGKSEPINIDNIRQGTSSGNRNDAAFKMATFLRKGGADKEQTVVSVTEWNKKNAPPLEAAEIKTIIDSAFAKDKPYGFFFDENPMKETTRIFADKLQMAERFHEIQPFFFDKSKSWWFWDKNQYCYKMKDETDLLNSLGLAFANVGVASLKSNEKSEIMESLRRVGRTKVPKKWVKSWVQFKDIVIDVEFGEELKPSPEYFCSNPIPWELGKTTETPNMDRIFTEWVGEKEVITLKEIAAYCILQDYPIHRIFALIGAGSNGKGKYLEMIKRFVGRQNVISSSLERMVNSRFEIAKLYKRLVCVMGETNSGLLTKTDFLKRASGGDMLPGEFKGKDNFDFFNYAKIIIASNSLPPTTDKTHGFYRRWDIVEWNNQFTEDKEILDEIPDEEYENLGRQCIEILKRMVKTRRFTNHKEIDERMQKYEEKSNPVIMIINQRYKRDINGATPFGVFYDELCEHLDNNKLRKMSAIEVSKIVRAEGFDIKNKNIDGETQKYIIGMKSLKSEKASHEKLPILPILSIIPLDSLRVGGSEKKGNKGNMGNSGNSENYLKKWRENGSKTLPKTSLLCSIGSEGVERLLELGLIYEPTPGMFKPV